MKAVARLGLLLVVLASPSVALAAAPKNDEVDELARSIDKDALALGTSDCVAACKALGSMRRAAERLCELDPGKRCADARAKVEDATAKVRASCPTCAIETPMTPSAPPKPSPESRPEPGSDATMATPASAPPAERSRGGCAGCMLSVDAPRSARDASPWLGIGALALLLRRRRQDPRTSRTATLPPRT